VADHEVLVRAIDEICAAARENNDEACRNLLTRLVPEFQSGGAAADSATAP